MTVSGMMFLANLIRRTVMERFLTRHRDRITGSITGFDRILFRGSLRSICYREGMDIFLSSQRVLYKDFRTFVQKLSAGIKARAEQLAQQAGRPFVYLSSAQESKEEIARRIQRRDRVPEGLICVLSCVEPCQTFGIRRDREKKELTLVAQERKCLHFYFYYLDREFGLMHIRLQSWLPMSVQVCVNGREWLARAMDREGITYEQKDNCFTRIADLPRAQALLDQLGERRWEKLLTAWARRGKPWVAPRAGLHLRGYYWSFRQAKYATDVLFQTTEKLAAIYPALVRQAIEQFGAPQVMRFLGRRTNSRFSGEASSHLERRVEGTCVKHRVEENSIKMYDKQGSVLRIETTINNPRRFRVRRKGLRQGKLVMKWLPLRRGIADIRRRAELSRAANARYLTALAVVGLATPSYRLLDRVSQRLKTKRQYRALLPISPEDASLFQFILHGEYSLQGFRNRDLQQALNHDPRNPSARISRLLALLRAHKLIFTVCRTNYYRITRKGR